jgi:hypothetical protein
MLGLAWQARNRLDLEALIPGSFAERVNLAERPATHVPVEFEPNNTPRWPVPFRPRKKKNRQAKYHRCSRCGGQVRKRSARCKKCSEPQKK